jgi:hypothetical protein
VTLLFVHHRSDAPLADHLTLRSGPQGRVSIARSNLRAVVGNAHSCRPPFETAASRPPQGEVKR